VLSPRSGGAAVVRVDAVEAPAAYWRFYEEVAAAQLAAWAPAVRSRVLDLSGGRERFAAQLVDAGHEVVHVCDTPSRVAVDPRAPGRLLPVVADARSLSWLADESVDAVLAESRALSTCLATEVTAADLLRVLRPGGRLLLVVDSLNAGLASLAEQGRWAELADVPAADVVLVTGPGGVITRVFWPVELAGLLTAVGFEVEWVRSRTLLSIATVERAVAQGGEGALGRLVETELQLAVEREGEAGGLHLVASARRPCASPDGQDA
jgi:SAM-dependent methyltransferase